MCSVLITITDMGGTSFGLNEKVSRLETTTTFPPALCGVGIERGVKVIASHISSPDCNLDA